MPGSIVIKSTDGVNWSATSGHPEASDSYSQFYQRVAYGNGKFVALSSTGYITTSTDGNSWSTPTSSFLGIEENPYSIIIEIDE